MHVAFRGWKQGSVLRAGSSCREVSGWLDSGKSAGCTPRLAWPPGSRALWPGEAEDVSPAGREPVEAELR